MKSILARTSLALFLVTALSGSASASFMVPKVAPKIVQEQAAEVVQVKTKSSLRLRTAALNLAAVSFVTGLQVPALHASTLVMNHAYQTSTWNGEGKEDTSNIQSNFIGTDGYPLKELEFWQKSETTVCFNPKTSVKHSKQKHKFFFSSQITPPGPNMRVRITNLTYPFLDEDQWPITDREYTEEFGSEKIVSQVENSHRKKNFTLFAKDGEVTENVLYFQVYDSTTGDIVERGEVILPVTIQKIETSKIGDPFKCNINRLDR